MYGHLCQQLIQEELFKIGHTKVTRKALTESRFRRTILGHCKSTFDKIFLKEEDLNKMDDEQRLKFNEKLLNNLKFVSYLYKYNLLNDSIVQNILKSLLEGHIIQEKTEDKEEERLPVTNFSIESALTFVTKIGVDIDRQIL